MVAGAAAKIEQPLRTIAAMAAQNPFDQIDFAAVVFRAIDRIVGIGLGRSKLGHAKHPRTAAQTRSISASPRPSPDGR